MIKYFKLKGVLTDQLLVRGSYRYLTVALFGDSPKFHRTPEPASRSKSESKKESDTNSDDDDFYDEWAYVKVFFLLGLLFAYIFFIQNIVTSRTPETNLRRDTKLRRMTLLSFY